MAAGRSDERDPAPAASAGWVARRLGITPATLRTWHYRYGVGASARSSGGHRRYSPDDIDRLGQMRKLVLAGMPVAEAARACAHEASDAAYALPAMPATPGRRGGGRILTLDTAEPRTRELAGAAMALDQPTLERTIAAALRALGVIPTWERLVVPVLQSIGARYGRIGDCVAVEHLFVHVVATALLAVTTRRRSWNDAPPVLLACPDQEQHALPLTALAAALAEARWPSRLLGASVPVPALTSAVRRIGPGAVFLWAQQPEFARRGDLDAIPRRRPPVAVLVGWPGWGALDLPNRAERVDTLAGAVDHCAASLSRQQRGPEHVMIRLGDTHWSAGSVGQ